MSPFEFFFTFYGLVLGLAAAELLNGLGGVLRQRRLSRIGPQTALLSLTLMTCILLTWLDAWTTYQGVALNLSVLLPPLIVSGCYYLAAVILFPNSIEDWASMDAYYADRKRLVVGLMLIAELVLVMTFWDRLGRDRMTAEPELFWYWNVPYNFTINALLVALIFVRGQRWNVAVLTALLFVYALPYWRGGFGQYLLSL